MCIVLILFGIVHQHCVCVRAQSAGETSAEKEATSDMKNLCNVCLYPSSHFLESKTYIRII